jgi:hypothetical protein
MVNKNMTSAHEQRIIKLWKEYKENNSPSDYLPINFYKWLEVNHRDLISFRCTFAEPKRVILALCYKN